MKTEQTTPTPTKELVTTKSPTATTTTPTTTKQTTRRTRTRTTTRQTTRQSMRQTTRLTTRTTKSPISNTIKESTPALIPLTTQPTKSQDQPTTIILLGTVTATIVIICLFFSAMELARFVPKTLSSLPSDYKTHPFIRNNSSQATIYRLDSVRLDQLYDGMMMERLDSTIGEPVSQRGGSGHQFSIGMNQQRNASIAPLQMQQQQQFYPNQQQGMGLRGSFSAFGMPAGGVVYNYNALQVPQQFPRPDRISDTGSVQSRIHKKKKSAVSNETSKKRRRR